MLPTLTVLAEIAIAGKVKVAPAAALMLLPAKTSDGRLPVPAESATAALAEAVTLPPNVTLPLATSCTVRLPPRLIPPRVTAVVKLPKSSVEPAAGTYVGVRRAERPGHKAERNQLVTSVIDLVAA